MKVYTISIPLRYKRKITNLFNIAQEFLHIAEASCSVVFCTEEEIKKFNKDYRSIDKVTDVLSFPMNELKVGDDLTKLKNEEGEIYLGDIAVCLKRAKQQAREYRHSLLREVCFLSLHGLLHILGYDHIKKEDEKLMNKTAEQILEIAKIRRKK